MKATLESTVKEVREDRKVQHKKRDLCDADRGPGRGVRRAQRPAAGEVQAKEDLET